MEYLRTAVFVRYPLLFTTFLKLFEKLPRKHPQKSLVLIMLKTLELEIFLKHNHTVLKQ